mmetsp:Transcript_22956/g.35123  ORF Transcript_22956/g.35123 Transcript_22956/m.35123 type:complete len:136 (-) Transcript_22956:176-583(-)
MEQEPEQVSPGGDVASSRTLFQVNFCVPTFEPPGSIATQPFRSPLSNMQQFLKHPFHLLLYLPYSRMVHRQAPSVPAPNYEQMGRAGRILPKMLFCLVMPKQETYKKWKDYTKNTLNEPTVQRKTELILPCRCEW